MRETILKEALRLKSEKNKKRADDLRIERESVLSLPDVAKAHTTYIQALYKEAISNPQNRPSQRINELQDAYLATLALHGYTEKDFEYVAECSLCNDTGLKNGLPCECIQEDFYALLEKACQVDMAGFTFDDFDASFFQNKDQANTLASIYSLMHSYVTRYPAVQKTILVFSGKIGTGKTLLAEAMTREMIRNGYAAIMLSAMEFNKLLVKVHTSHYSECDILLNDIMTADMLVIDDLGTEPPYRNITCEYLLLVLEERSRKKLATVITTNLSGEKIMHRYNERIYSRLHDKHNSIVLPFEGDDLRQVDN